MRRLITFSFFIIIASFIACQQNNLSDYIYIEGFTQGTTYYIAYQDNKNRNYQSKISSILKKINKSFSTYIPNSVISKINKGSKPVKVNENFKAVFNKAIEISEKTRGAFDITIAPLVNAWGFGVTDRIKTDSAVVDSLLQFVGINKVKLENNRIIKENNQVMLDMNAIAQGFTADLIAEFLFKKGINNYLVEIGGEVNARGKKLNGDLWKIGIDKPIENSNQFNRQLQTVLQLSNRSLATSGNYRKFYVENGVKYAHSINPETGFPVKHNLLSVTVIAEDCMTADAFATAFMVMGMQKSKDYVNNDPELEAYFIFSNDSGDFEVYYTEGISQMIIEN